MLIESESAARVWRLSLALTGDADRSGEILCAIARRHGELNAIGESRLDRSVVGAALRTDLTPWPDLPPACRGLWDALALQVPRERIAWVLSRVFETHENGVALALDRPVSAVRQLLERSGRALAGVDGLDVSAGLESLRAFLDRPVPDDVIMRAEAAQEGGAKHRRNVLIAQFGALVAVGAILAFVLYDLRQWDDDRADEARRAAQYSVPMPGGEPSASEPDGLSP